MPRTLDLWRTASRLPGGRLLFSAAVMARAPYFATVLPTVRVMEPGRAEVTAPKWFGVHNHIGTFHAIATCNLAEVVMGMLAEATVPSSHRWLPKSMTVRYVAKARSRLRAVATLDELPAFGPAGFDLPVPVTVYGTDGRPVTEAVITLWITPRKR
jgi:acyl-coenzyme A thioesterase PaaI-like protein